MCSNSATVNGTSREPIAALADYSFCGVWQVLHDGALRYGSICRRLSLYHEEYYLVILISVMLYQTKLLTGTLRPGETRI